MRADIYEKLDKPADSVAKAIVRWKRKGSPIPHSEPL